MSQYERLGAWVSGAKLMWSPATWSAMCRRWEESLWSYSVSRHRKGKVSKMTIRGWRGSGDWVPSLVSSETKE